SSSDGNTAMRSGTTDRFTMESMSSLEGNILDSKAYILMLRARLEKNADKGELFNEAKKLFLKAFELPPFIYQFSTREWFYRYALTLDYLGEAAEADKYYNLSADAGYRPTHELLLIPRPARQ